MRATTYVSGSAPPAEAGKKLADVWHTAQPASCPLK